LQEPRPGALSGAGHGARARDETSGGSLDSLDRQVSMARFRLTRRWSPDEDKALVLLLTETRLSIAAMSARLRRRPNEKSSRRSVTRELEVAKCTDELGHHPQVNLARRADRGKLFGSEKGSAHGMARSLFLWRLGTGRSLYGGRYVRWSVWRRPVRVIANREASRRSGGAQAQTLDQTRASGLDCISLK
jgi:hypothetical protein